jgi:ribosomal protein L29
MKLSDITKKTDAELVELLHKSREELATAIIDSRTKEVTDVKQQGRLKKTIARVMTLSRERAIAKEEATQ